MKILLALLFLVLNINNTFVIAAPFGNSASSNNADSSFLKNNFNIVTNTNKPEVWQDQLGGYMTGGSIHTRIPSSNLQILTLDPPSVNMGCGGIDLYGGGFGYINSKNLEKLMKNIGTSAVSYAMMLTLKSISPQISDLLENLEAIARFINGQNINSCQMGMSIAAGLSPKNQAAQEMACQSRKMNNNTMAGGISDFFTARYDCSSSSNLNNIPKGNDDMLGAEYNLVWEALKKESSGLNKADKEFLMSLSGTLIAKKGNKNNITFTHQNSLVKDFKLLEAMVFGGTNTALKLYICDEENNCLNPKLKTYNFKNEDSILYKITKIMESLEQKILEENAGATEQLSPQEKDFIIHTSVPIVKLISLNAGIKGHGIKNSLEDYSEVAAFDYIINYLDSLIDFIYKALSALEHAQIEGEVIKNFKTEIRYIKKLLANEKINSYERLNILLSVKQRTKQIETMVLTSFAEYRGN